MSDDPAPDHFTERMEPEAAHPRIFWEHVERYRFARPFVPGKRVLDIACGEGYGAAALGKAGATSVVGIDVSQEACDKARAKYGLDARPGDAQAIPLPDASVDVVVSFETVEHVNRTETFIDECARVLADDGVLIISTPNRPIYTGEHEANPFHLKEFDEDEFRELLARRFGDVTLFTQFPRTAAWWHPRSLAAERSPWLKIKGFWRFSTWICPALGPNLEKSARDSVEQVIQSDDRYPSRLFNPYVVRPIRHDSHEEPYVFVAVARGVRRDLPMH